MTITLGSNIASLRGIRELGRTTAELSRTFKRLSSGLRINRASDDPAGLALADELASKHGIYVQATRNVNDGISYLSIAEAGVGNLDSVLTRIKELAVQSSNAVLSDTQRQALDTEAQSLVEEYNRVIEESEFNGRAVFLKQGPVVIQAGYQEEERLVIDFGNGGGIDPSAEEGEELVAETIRVSVDSSGTQGNNFSFLDAGAGSAISSDGRYVAFRSFSSNLVVGDTNGQPDIFVHDRETGATTRVSVDSSGIQANGFSDNFSISRDGRYVAFQSAASNLVAGDTNAQLDIFVHDRQTGATTRVSVDSVGTQANNASYFPTISDDGRYVAFRSAASNLVAGDTNVQLDIFVHDRQTGATTRVSVDSVGTQANSYSEAPSISGDGRYVAFYSAASNLVGGDTNVVEDIFMHDLQTGTTTRVSVDSVGTEGNGASFNAWISGDGRYITFESDASNLVAGDTNAVRDILVHDLQTGDTVRVSVDSVASQGNGSSTQSSITGDGRYVAFRSAASNLVGGDTNGAQDIFVHDRQTGQTIRVSTDSTGTEGNAASNTPSISDDGRYVAFDSGASNLVAGDTNSRDDVFVAANTLFEGGGGGETPPSFGQFHLTLLANVDLSTQSAALATIDVLDDYSEELDDVTGRITASQSQFSIALENLYSLTSNLSSAESSIREIDVAREVAKLVGAQIRQESATAMLAQANQQPALALQLLSGR